MKTIRSRTDLTPTWPIETIAPPQNLLFFDIETTGFSANTSTIYLIGCLYYETSSASWQIIQWFSETLEDEPALLTAFLSFLGNYTTLIHYNGDAFDLPFIRKRSEFHNLDLSLSSLTSIDLYKKIRPWKTALSLTSLKQKAMEQFLGIRRAAPYTGRQLIAAYQDYLISRKTALFHMLLQHNEEDLRGLLQLLPLFTYAMLPKMTFSFIHQKILSFQDILSFQGSQNLGSAKTEPDSDRQNAETAKTQDNTHPCLELLYQIPDAFGAFPVPFHLETPLFSIHGEHTQILCRLPMVEGELKYFYPDYKNYYYLPCEDMAIHKSVGSYVAKEARQKATPQTCYVKKTGLFLPQIIPLWQPVFHLSYQSSPAYVEYREELFSDPENAGAFLRQLFPKS